MKKIWVLLFVCFILLFFACYRFNPQTSYYPLKAVSIDNSSNSSDSTLTSDTTVKSVKVRYEIQDAHVLEKYQKSNTIHQAIYFDQAYYVEYNHSFEDCHNLKFQFGAPSFEDNTYSLQKNFYQIYEPAQPNMDDGALNENGSLSSNFCVMLLPVKITNQSDKEQNFFLNRLWLMGFPKELEKAERYPVVPSYQDQVANPHSNNPNYMRVTIKPQETFEVEIGYWVTHEVRQPGPLYIAYNDDVNCWNIALYE
ncbi:hypothetical protein [uncultured Ruthenibacterium sp.]|uniref:hypothetical protein n=1 Tax=uncultured Ruthenibacterium sp. TaxID=1905347 RepID=UPI00349E6ACC